MRNVDELTIDALQKECELLRAELAAAERARDEWRCRHRLACITARNLCDELKAIRQKQEAGK